MRYLTFFLLIAVTGLQGQTPASHFIKRPALQSGLIFQRWTNEADQKLDEIVVPLLIHFPVNERLSVSLLNTPTRAQFSNANASMSLTAFTDTKISTALILGDERALLNFGVNVPSGPTAFDAKETVVAQVITSHVLAMPTTYFGGGLEASASLAGAVESGAWIFGGSFGGIYKSSFTPTTGAGKYLPGPEISFSLGFDRPLSERNRIFGDVGYTWYGADKLAGKKVFQADGKIDFNVAGIWATEKWETTFFLTNRLKRQSPFALNNSFSVSYGNEVDFSAELARQLNREAALLVLTQLRIHGKNKNGIGKATVLSLGPGWRGLVSSHLQLEASLRLSGGKLDGGRILGGEVNLGLIYQL